MLKKNKTKKTNVLDNTIKEYCDWEFIFPSSGIWFVNLERPHGKSYRMIDEIKKGAVKKVCGLPRTYSLGKLEAWNDIMCHALNKAFDKNKENSMSAQDYADIIKNDIMEFEIKELEDKLKNK